MGALSCLTKITQNSPFLQCNNPFVESPKTIICSTYQQQPYTKQLQKLHKSLKINTLIEIRIKLLIFCLTYYNPKLHKII